MAPSNRTSVEPEADARRDGEQGYVFALSALMLVPMLVFTAFATDVGAWYVRAQEIQRAADAAALAAVVWMPDTDQAADVAFDVAARNGFVDQPGEFDDPNAPLPQIQVSQVGTQRVRVDIRAEGDLYFGSVVESFEEPQIHRYATAEYILPVPMGNPTSALGTGIAPVGDGTNYNERLWLAVNGYCTGRGQGDLLSSRYQGWHDQCDEGPGSSEMTLANPQYDADGYYLIIDFPENSDTTTWDIQFYDPGFCDTTNERTSTPVSAWENGVNLDTNLYRADDTPLDDYDNIDPSNLFASRTFTDSDCGWVSTYQINGALPRGRWVLNYRSLPNLDDQGLNYFGVRVVPEGTNSVCTTLGGVNVDTCPRVSAMEWLPIYAGGRDKAGNDVFPANTAATFYLAEVDQVHAGKVLELTLFDPGERMDNLQIIAPDGTRLPFTYETIDNQSTPPVDREYWGWGAGEWNAMADYPVTNDDNCAGVNCLRVTGSRYQNRTVRIYVEIPNGYTCTTDCWWRIRYAPEAGETATDRTTWAVRVTGDPVRLIE